MEDAVACWKKTGAFPFDADVIHAVHVDSLREFASIAKTGEVAHLWSDLVAA